MGTRVDSRDSSHTLPASLHRVHQPTPAIAAITSSKLPASRLSAPGQWRRREALGEAAAGGLSVSGVFKTRSPH